MIRLIVAALAFIGMSATANAQVSVNAPLTLSSADANPVKNKKFTPEFNEALHKCWVSSERDNNLYVEVIGKKDGKCVLKYAGYIFKIPDNILPEVMGFADLDRLASDRRIADYEITPSYVYEGLTYALAACAHNTDYFGVEQVSGTNEELVRHGLHATYHNDNCEVHLRNEMMKDGRLEDYGMVCTVPMKVLNRLKPYFNDLSKNNAGNEAFLFDMMKVVPVDPTDKTRRVDTSLMYYIQHEGYCKNAAELAEVEALQQPTDNADIF